jgi:hypothetical protein
MASQYVDLPPTFGVLSLNGLTGPLNLVAGANITITPSGSNITIASTGGGGSPGGSNNQFQFNNSGAFAGSPNLVNSSGRILVGGVTDDTVSAFQAGGPSSLSGVLNINTGNTPFTETANPNVTASGSFDLAHNASPNTLFGVVVTNNISQTVSGSTTLDGGGNGTINLNWLDGGTLTITIAPANVLSYLVTGGVGTNDYVTQVVSTYFYAAQNLNMNGGTLDMAAGNIEDSVIPLTVYLGGTSILQSKGLTIGSDYVGTFPPTNGAIIEGRVLIGTTSSDSISELQVPGSGFIGTLYVGADSGANPTGAQVADFNGSTVWQSQYLGNPPVPPGNQGGIFYDGTNLNASQNGGAWLPITNFFYDVPYGNLWSAGTVEPAASYGEAIAIGVNAGLDTANASYAVLLGFEAGLSGSALFNAIAIGTNAMSDDTVNNAISNSSIAIGRYSGTGGFSDSIALGRGVINSATQQANIGNVLYLNGIYSLDTQSSTPTGGNVGINTNTPVTTLEVNGAVTVDGSMNSAAPQTTYNGDTSGTLIYSMPFQGVSYSKWVGNLQSLVDSGAFSVFTFPTPFANTPYVYGDVAAIAGVTVSTTQITFPATAGVTGNVFVEGF